LLRKRKKVLDREVGRRGLEKPGLYIWPERAAALMSSRVQGKKREDLRRKILSKKMG